MDEQRYQPMPSIDELPAWLWRRTGQRARIVLGLTLVATALLTAVLVPAMRRDQRARAAAEQHAEAVRHTASVAALIREQRPRFGRSAAPQRAAMLGDLESAIVSDARARHLDGPILHARCDPFPKTVGAPPPERDPRKAAGSYSCVAVTSEIDRSAASSGGEIGHLYRASLDFTTGRFALCKVAGRPDPVPDPEVTTPRACADGRLPAP